MSSASVPDRLIALALLTQMSIPPNVSTVWRDRVGDRLLVADVADDRQRLAAGLLDLLGGRVDGAFELGVRLGRLGDQRDVRAVARGAHGDREPDAA